LQASHFKERNTIPPDILRELVVSGNAQVTLSAGVLYPELLEDTIFLKTLPPAIRASLGLGKALLKKSSSDIQTRQSYSQELSTLAFSGDGRLFERAVARGLVLHSYEDASSILLQRLKDNKDPRESIRLLKTLIEIDNPKGRAMATQFFTHKELPESLRMYLLKKLLACGYWDANLIPKLEENEKEGKREQTDAILCALITRLGLTPDLAVFNALESPGILKGETLQDRVSELLSLRTQFSELPLQELREMLKDEDKRKIFYMVKGGEYKYTLINDYSFEKFSLVLSKINEESLDERAPDRFQKSLARAKKTAKEQKHIIEAFLAGRVPLVDPNQRVFSFDSRVDLGSEYELAMNRLQEIWNNELRALILAGNRESIPAGLGDALRDTEEREPTTKKQKISLGFLEVGGKKDYQALCELAQKVKKELESRAQKFPDKQRKRIRLNEIEGYNIQRLFTQYLQVQLPKLKDTFLLSEWESHLAEILPKLQAGRVEGRSVDKSFELTFLDKAKDFVRSLRFADGQQCCFNSKNYDIQDGMGSSDWIAKLNADPLSFLIDLKEKDSRIIAGFVFGRMGIDPKSKKPIVMINGIYSQEGGGAIESNILKIIEEQFAGKIGACKVVIASKHGGTLTKIPQGYTKVENLSIEAIRALTDNDKVYDDIGDVANGEFQFSGYYKDL